MSELLSTTRARPPKSLRLLEPCHFGSLIPPTLRKKSTPLHQPLLYYDEFFCLFQCSYAICLKLPEDNRKNVNKQVSMFVMKSRLFDAVFNFMEVYSFAIYFNWLEVMLNKSNSFQKEQYCGWMLKYWLNNQYMVY